MNKGEIVAGLGFARLTEMGEIDYWPPSSLTWDKQCLAGRERADTVIKFARESGEPTIILRVLQAVGESYSTKSDRGLEVGFFQRIAEELS